MVPILLKSMKIIVGKRTQTQITKQNKVRHLNSVEMSLKIYNEKMK